MARFDWYQATVEAQPGEVLDCLLAGLPDRPEAQALERAPNGYGGGWRVVAGGSKVCELWAGGTHALPHVIFTGEPAHEGAEFLRTHYQGRHLPTRLDGAEDYAEPGAYDQLQALCLDVAKERKIKVGTAGDHLLTKEGRTVYLGSTKSHAMVRLYDKAAEQRAKLQADPVRLLAVPEHLARLEVQVRPKTREARQLAATVDPVSLFGAANWTRLLMQRLTGLDIEPCNMGKAWRQSDDDRAYAAMLAQYGGLLGRLGAEQGWDCLGLQIRDDLALRAEAKAKHR